VIPSTWNNNCVFIIGWLAQHMKVFWALHFTIQYKFDDTNQGTCIYTRGYASSHPTLKSKSKDKSLFRLITVISIKGAYRLQFAKGTTLVTLQLHLILDIEFRNSKNIQRVFLWYIIIRKGFNFPQHQLINCLQSTGHCGGIVYIENIFSV